MNNINENNIIYNKITIIIIIGIMHLLIIIFKYTYNIYYI